MISVVMPVYNAKDFVEKAIDSILNQTEKDLELIIIDDCGTDGTMDIVSKIKDNRIRIVKNEKNMGIAYSRNKAIELSKGDYICPMDHDDISPLDRLEVSLKFLNNNKNIAVVGGSFIKINEHDQQITFSKRVFCNPKRIKADLMFRNMFANGSTMIRKEFIVKNNLKYKDNQLGMEDYKFWLDASLVGEMANLERVMLYMRKHKNNETLKNMTDKTQERADLFNRIRLETFKKNGFELSDEQQEIFCKSFDELQNKSLSKNELDKALEFLKDVIGQAYKINFDDAKQFEYACHDIFAIKTRTSYLWK